MSVLETYSTEAFCYLEKSMRTFHGRVLCFALQLYSGRLTLYELIEQEEFLKQREGK